MCASANVVYMETLYGVWYSSMLDEGSGSNSDVDGLVFANVRIRLDTGDGKLPLH